MPAPGRRGLAAAACAALLAVLGCAAAPIPAYAADPTGGTTSGEVAEQPVTVPVKAEPDGTAVSLDASVFTPSSPGPHPALLLAHGFGGSKADLVDRARD